MIEMYLADDKEDGLKTIFLTGKDKMYVINFNEFVFNKIKEESNPYFILGANLESEPLDKARMINPTLIKTFN